MMTKKILLFTLVIAFYQYGFCQVRKGSLGEKLLTKGMKISGSMKIKKQTYKFDADTSMTRAVITIRFFDCISANDTKHNIKIL